MPRTNSAATDRKQLDLFSILAPPSRTTSAEAGRTPTARAAPFVRAETASAPLGSSKDQRSKPRLSQPPVDRHVVTLGIRDMPVYPPELVAAVTRSIKEAKTDRVMLTYKEIDAFFGVSRATVARRLKDGLVPGIRIRHGRVLEDGSVRRLDRTQLLYLLLAVRVSRT